MRIVCWTLIFFAIASPLSAAEKPDFAREVLPILSEHCFACHGPDPASRKAELRLDTAEGAATVIVPGRSGESELIRRLLTSEVEELMPPPRAKKPLSTGQIAVLRRWVDYGAGWGQHWAFEPIKRPAVPQVPEGPAPVRNPIDAFIQARLRQEGLTPSPEADPATLIRRLSLDLTGLPPTPEEVADFRNDSRPEAYERDVDRLLASPRFGERMAWEWLDAARYADSNGYQGDMERTMWPWRDWVVKAFNQDLPFDQFTILQLAGDLLPNATTEQTLATGFLRNHMINGEGGRIAEENRVDYVMDMTETVGTVWLGLTFNCCRCHDHKFDPLRQEEYYQLFAFFNQTPITGGGREGQMPPVVELASAHEKAKLQEFSQRIATLAETVSQLEAERFPPPPGPRKTAADSDAARSLPVPVRDALKVAPGKRNTTQLSQLQQHFVKSEPKSEYTRSIKELYQQVSQREGVNRGIVRVMVMRDQPNRRETFILDKGLYNKPTRKVDVGTPAVLPALTPATSATVPNRLDLARWLVTAENPLTRRVIVNRFWQQIFGVGLVKTPEDFGIQGARPSHPELLDWLAAEFQERGWSVKQLLKLLVTSHTYRQQSTLRDDADPENRLLSRGPRYRLPSWMIRDQALFVSGLLVEKLGGRPVNPYQPPGIWEEATFGTKKYQQDHGEALYRRSLYTFWRRIIGPTLFFDAAARQTCTVKITRTNTPLHALTTLNDVTFVEAARVLAEKLLHADADNDAKRLEQLYSRVLARAPRPQEMPILLAGLTRLRQQYQADPTAADLLLKQGEYPRSAATPAVEHAAWTTLCLTVLNLDETLTRE